MQESTHQFKPYVSADTKMAEFTIKSVILGGIFGIIFGAANVYLALKAGLTVSASIPISVMAISLGRKLFKTTILENNIIQTAGSAGESIASGVAFTLPAFLFLSIAEGGKSVGADYFNYLTIFTLAAMGGILGTLMMIPLRRSLIVKEHGNLPYPEGTACASVLIAGEKGGDFSKTAYQGLGFAILYAIFQKIFNLIAAVPAWTTQQTNKYFPSATVSGEITPEYLGVGYIIGPRIAGVLVAGGVLASLALIPLLAFLVPGETVATQLIKLGYMKDLVTAGGDLGWNPITKTFEDTASAIYYAYVRQIGAGAVAIGGLMTLLKSIPTIVRSFKESLGSLNDRQTDANVSRTERDLSFRVVIIGSVILVLLILFMPQIPSSTLLGKLLIGILVIVFGFFFVTVSSRIVGLIGSSSNPISGMTIATLMGTCLIFISVGWTGKLFEPMALVVGAIICIAAANAGATSQDLKTGYIIGATPKYQQLALFIGAVVSSVVIGATIKMLDTPTEAALREGITHTIGTKAFPAPQGTLMATLIRGLLSFNLDWQFVLVGAFLSITIELCGVNALSFAVGAYLPLSTTLPIFVGGAIKGLVDWKMKKQGRHEDDELGKGSLFATGLVAGGAVAGVLIAFAAVLFEKQLQAISWQTSLEKALGHGGYQLLGTALFAFMGLVLYRIAMKKE
ncbi:oligopeptide transporter, OPT family [Solitalea sp. MAHUQ-68]|uniref:Oligopeptide transporter, OPT family n=1 Tax=Solitalea agri TaxID=2953739 RepID=A0A9X2EZP7_9SPHI|nr:oligopeptide transporter, OPT family [Solitalea agri]MCO4291395.1 oligopeptide transporter, OPT family [Solitalea agri]